MKKTSVVFIFISLFLLSLVATQLRALFTVDYYRILELIILPRTLVALIAGGALATIGYQFQILFKNSLATPYTTGLSSVAALCLAVSELLTSHLEISNDISFIIYFVSSLSFLFMMFIILNRKMARNSLLLFGVSVGIVSSSLIIFVQSFLGNESVSKLVRWMMGNIDTVGFKSPIILLIISTLMMIYVFRSRKELTLLSISEDFAHTRGVDVHKLFNYSFFISNIFLVALIWFCGPIGFIGLIVPHITQKVFGADFSKNIVFNFLLGASLLMLATTLSKVLISTHVIPVGAITASIGAPFLVYLLLKKKF